MCIHIRIYIHTHIGAYRNAFARTRRIHARARSCGAAMAAIRLACPLRCCCQATSLELRGCRGREQAGLTRAHTNTHARTSTSTRGSTCIIFTTSRSRSSNFVLAGTATSVVHARGHARCCAHRMHAQSRVTPVQKSAMASCARNSAQARAGHARCVPIAHASERVSAHVPTSARLARDVHPRAHA